MNINKFDDVLMDSAFLWSRLSTCNRRKVGCVIAKDSRILSTGYNGTLSGMDNCCEDTNNNTKDSVLHAEQNALMFSLKNGICTQGATLYCTDAPCSTCAKLIAQSGIMKVFYSRDYRDTSGLDLLAQAGIITQKLVKN